MKNKLRLLCGLAFFLCALCAPALAQSDTLSSQLSTLSSPPAPWYSTPAFWTTVFAFVSGLLAIWRNSVATARAKINESLVLGIEQATKLPQVAAFETQIKQTIQEKATQLGVQPLLHRIVQDLTEPAATAADKPLSG